jgi:glycosyltransferase involved in cell wall biosynthesis
MQKVLIVSSDDYILYQPTILNLYDFLQKDFDVTVISFEPNFLGKKKDTKRQVIYLACPEWKRKAARIVDLFTNALLKRIDKYLFRFKYRSQLVRGLKCNILTRALREVGPSHIIAVDVMPLYAALQVHAHCHFLSLEILPYDSYLRKIDKDKIQAVIIQNKSRYDYLFKGKDLPTFYIQNAPFCKDIYVNHAERRDLLWAGSIVKEFDVFKCLDFVKAYPEYHLVLKGAANEKTRQQLMADYKDLLQSGHVVINEEYLSAENFISFLSQFAIGFCFYSWDLIRNNFNYQSAPSGKLFMYLAAGVPVIACNIPAFKFVEEYEAGILIDDYEPATIYQAIKTIERDYNKYHLNSYKAATDCCFDNGAGKFKDYLLSGESMS